MTLSKASNVNVEGTRHVRISLHQDRTHAIRHPVSKWPSRTGGRRPGILVFRAVDLDDRGAYRERERALHFSGDYLRLPGSHNPGPDHLPRHRPSPNRGTTQFHVRAEGHLLTRRSKRSVSNCSAFRCLRSSRGPRLPRRSKRKPARRCCGAPTRPSTPAATPQSNRNGPSRRTNSRPRSRLKTKSGRYARPRWRRSVRSRRAGCRCSKRK